MVDSEKKQQPKLLIITGPQGSGNHLFAKIFSMHPSVEGWPMLRDEWQGHHEEPFADYWQEPKTLKDKVWERQYYVTSISCPYFKDKQPQIPKYREFINEAKKYCEVIICIIGRDRNILEHQQNRVRDGHTTPTAIIIATISGVKSFIVSIIPCPMALYYFFDIHNLFLIGS